MITILHKAQKEYYSNLLEENKSNAKVMWNTLSILIKSQSSNNFPHEFMGDSQLLKNKNHIANGFNAFFANVGPYLAKKIFEPPGNLHVNDFVQNQNYNSMFLTDVSKEELIKIVNSLKSKTSKDVNDLSMKVIKRVFNCIVSPFYTYVTCH